MVTLLLVAPLSANAQGQTPQAFLEELYRPYRQKDFKGQPYWETSRYFAPDLAAEIDKDMAAASKRNEVPLLDGDPFIDAQDWEITDLTVASSVDGGSAKGAISFKNAGQPKTVTVFLVQTPKGWRIADIVSPNGSLRKLYKLP
ncbi:Protein of unknown function [Enhydrobacter aerosaccus]|uniref:DUF3828 domain-containing protein n=2 Tax=Enhydrobacter aerosaccus TaxID=225324 RepID=A0A1T4K7I9_9HYPH|nr:Protein of unknown function [Enhydrobacter aerosaccus]